MDLRIASLIPSATEICIALGLAEYIVGVTHECPKAHCLDPKVRILTQDGLMVSNNNTNKEESSSLLISQGSIHQQVTEQFAKVACTTRVIEDAAINPPSLYPIQNDELLACSPTLIITQDLCHVCAPSSPAVQRIISNITSSSSSSGSNTKEDGPPMILSLSPQTLMDVGETFVMVAEACSIVSKGHELRDTFVHQLNDLRDTIQNTRNNSILPYRILILEWLDPPFNSGHWIIDMMEVVGLIAAIPLPSSSATSRKSIAISWKEVQEADPDVIIIACCGFDLQRNYDDTIQIASSPLMTMRAAHNGMIFAANGNAYFANPGPSLLTGTAIMAICAYHNQPAVVQAIRNLSFISHTTTWSGFQKVEIVTTAAEAATVSRTSINVPIMVTDLPNTDIEDCHKLHEKACQNGELTYIDPISKYTVFTEVAHKRRGYCCGSGCRHCPYAHVNVKDKVLQIRQPAILHVGERDGLFSIEHGKTHVVFFSGGKDSFLAIRALTRKAKLEPFGLVLLTTFDVESRMIAHQDISLDLVMKQVQHLGLTWVGVPLHRASSESYSSRIRRALDVVENHIGHQVTALVFGDLHLEQIRQWREEHLGSLGYETVYPLWQVDYNLLWQDLVLSEVPCVVSASTVDDVQVGQSFNQEFIDRITPIGIDLFGEEGGFHTVAEVWEVSRNKALGI